VSVYPVPAYSTLGMSDWVGGDPLLNTFISWPEGELARLIFHELSHQQVYVAGDTPFNEAFATAVERLGAERWLQANGSQAAQSEYQAINARRLEVRLLLGRYREALETLYRTNAPDSAKRAGKQELLAAMRQEQADLKVSKWKGFAGYDAYFRDANNATLGVQAAYDGLVPAFDALFEREGRDFSRFYQAVQRLASLPKRDRDAALDLLLRPAQAPG
jgi:predicted aminopeptidase